MFVSEEDLRTVDCNEVTVNASNIHSVQPVETFIHCLNKYCSRRLLQPSAGKIVHCDRCGYTRRSSNCTKQVCAKIVVQLDSGEQIIIIHHLYSATLLKDPAALYNKGDINIKPIKS